MNLFPDSLQLTGHILAAEQISNMFQYISKKQKHKLQAPSALQNLNFEFLPPLVTMKDD
jgi:hypothetical protein